ncbi:MAG: hypothetical protein KA165_03260 [Saprospiraceae bacterium]|nr:hypothetical protein [Saprospiraceae bacterium]
MNTEKTIEKIKNIDWEEYNGPEYFSPSEVIESLCHLVLLTEDHQKPDVYNSVLFAIGNNHAGTYYPVIREALHFILEVAVEGDSEVARNCALDILTDLYMSFVPDTDESTKFTAAELKGFVEKEMKGYEPVFLEILSAGKDSERNLNLILDILDAIKKRS